MTAVIPPPPDRRYAVRGKRFMKKSLERPAHPERICWGCDKFCPADDLACGNGTVRTQHPCELLGDDWLEWSERDRSEHPRTEP